MADQYARQDQNRFPALLGHSGTAGTAETVRIVAGTNGELLTGGTLNTQSQPYAVVVDGTTTANVNYVGEAETGASTGSSVWRIKKLDETVSDVLTITWADGNGSFDNLWTGRGTILFS